MPDPSGEWELSMPVEKEAVRIATAAAMLEYDPSTIRRYIRQGDLEVTGTGRARRVTMRSIRTFLDGARGVWQNRLPAGPAAARSPVGCTVECGYFATINAGS